MFDKEKFLELELGFALVVDIYTVYVLKLFIFFCRVSLDRHRKEELNSVAWDCVKWARALVF